ncbi:MAG: AMP-binding protein, partial [Actinobacteria bacterium]|nr:AMP-binding protein [Actinomycetota bacterium]
MESYARGETDQPLLAETIGRNLARTVAAHPDREALVEVASGRRWSWSELSRDVDAVARGLLALGLEVGDRVGMWAPNCAEWTIVQLATARVGIVLVNVNPAYRTHELAYAVNQSGMRVILAASAFKTSDYRAMVDEVRDDCPALERALYVDTGDWAELLEGGAGVAEDAVTDRAAGLSPY